MIQVGLVVSLLFFSFGIIGMLVKRNVLAVLMSAELILNGANLALITFSRELEVMDGHILAFIVMTVAACEGAIGLAMIINLYRLRRRVELDTLATLKG